MIKDIVRRINTLPNADDFYVSQLRDGVSIGYAPRYPEKTPADFSVYLSAGTIKMYSPTPTVAIIKEYSSLNELFKDLENMDK